MRKKYFVYSILILFFVGGGLAAATGMLIIRNKLNNLAAAVNVVGDRVDALRQSNEMPRLVMSPEDIVLGQADTYAALDRDHATQNQTGDRAEIPCGEFRDADTLVLLILGQSNAANYGDVKFTPPSSVGNFNIYDGKCYRAEDPLLGASFDGGSFGSRLADLS